MNSKEILISYVGVCNLHAQRLSSALLHVEYLLPFTEEKISNMKESDAAFLEVVTSRFAKLQDTLGQKVFPLVLVCEGEDVAGKTFLDILNMFEKFGFIEDKDFWLELRQTRNIVAHEYPDNLEKLVEALNEVYSESQELLEYWKFLSKKISKFLV